MIALPLASNLLEFDSIASVIIGCASLFGGRGSVVGMLIGVLKIVMIRNGLNLMGCHPSGRARRSARSSSPRCSPSLSSASVARDPAAGERIPEGSGAGVGIRRRREGSECVAHSHRL
jgi:hypothetical protein